ncbi:hypothetical protein Tco_0808536 [Tanacetum coccineum]
MTHWKRIFKKRNKKKAKNKQNQARNGKDKVKGDQAANLPKKAIFPAQQTQIQLGDVLPYFSPAKPLDTLAKIISSTLLTPPSCINAMLAIPLHSQVFSMAVIDSKEAQKKLKAGICFRITSHNKHTWFLLSQKKHKLQVQEMKTSAIYKSLLPSSTNLNLAGPARPVVIREPDSGRIQPLPEVQGKGKEKVAEEQVAHDLLTLQTPKLKNPIDQFIFQRRTPMPTKHSEHADSPSLDAELALTIQTQIFRLIKFDDQPPKPTSTPTESSKKDQGKKRKMVMESTDAPSPAK